MEFFESLQSWHWLILGIALLLAETLGAAGFLLGTAIAALLMAALAWLVPGLGWQSQLALFAIAAITFTALYWKFFKGYNEKTDAPHINNRALQLVGRTFVLKHDLDFGEGRVQIGDTFWRARASSALAEGATVTVVGAEGMVLLVEEVTAGER
jgi:hypothetical protein